MSLAIPLRRALRQPLVRRAVTRRLESTTTAKATETAKETAAKAQQTVAGVTSKASQGLSRVTSAAGPALGRAASGLSRMLGRVGGRTGRTIAFVERTFLRCLLMFSGAPQMGGQPDGDQLEVQWLTLPVCAGQVPLAIYYSRVGIELSKIVFRGQSMAPP